MFSLCACVNESLPPHMDAADTGSVEEGDTARSNDTADAADAADAGGELRSCSSQAMGECAPTELCVHTSTGYCGEYLGVCFEQPEDCQVSDSLWRACECDRSVYRSACEARRQGVSNMLEVCWEARGTSCAVGDVEACGSDVCVPSVIDGATDDGVCLSLDTVCAATSTGMVCAVDAPGQGVRGGLQECWIDACAAYTSGYRGFLAYSDAR